MRPVLGIDPGQSGALVLIDPDTRTYLAHLMPAAPRVGLRKRELWVLLRSMSLTHDPEVLLEKAQPMPKQGSVSGFKYGRDYGCLLMALTALDMPFLEVTPAVWHRAVCGRRKRSEGRAGAKQRALRVVEGRLPALELKPGRRSKPHEGIVDAACLALYGLDKR